MSNQLKKRFVASLECLGEYHYECNDKDCECKCHFRVKLHYHNKIACYKSSCQEKEKIMKLYLAFHEKNKVKVSIDLDCLPASSILVQWTDKYTVKEVLDILTSQGHNVCVDTGTFFQDYT